MGIVEKSRMDGEDILLTSTHLHVTSPCITVQVVANKHSIPTKSHTHRINAPVKSWWSSLPMSPFVVFQKFAIVSLKLDARYL